jgi:hypothetical protein
LLKLIFWTRLQRERERERERNDAKHLDRPFDGERVAMVVKPAPSFGRGE